MRREEKSRVEKGREEMRREEKMMMSGGGQVRVGVRVGWEIFFIFLSEFTIYVYSSITFPSLN